MYSPPPPPQAGRAFVRQMFRRTGSKPDVAATLVSHADSEELEFVNGGGPAHSITWTTGTDGGVLGDLGPGETASAHLGEQSGDDFRCVWTALDDRGRMHVWSYDGRHHRLGRHDAPAPDAAFAQMYPG